MDTEPKKVDNLFDQVLIIAHRTKQLAHGHVALVETDNEKNTVIAMREYEEGKIDKQILNQETELTQSVEDILSQAYSNNET
ncbi:MAG: DNA-directed RNA polymerase subunit omega [Methylacidiphilales bacterium]|nr:DNA-directed RNA polymerase subunit omega [Candidatus Methylacidiphilales bacterium]